MGEQMTGGLARGFRAAMALLLAVALSLPAGALNVQAYADEPMQTAAAAGAQTQALGGDESEIKIAVLSDMHYYPVNFVSDCEDYETYVGGDPKMLEESGSIADAALQMVREDNPDILLVSGDLTKDGEIQGHRDLASKFQKLEDETDIEVFVINGNHDLYNYTDACTFENGQKESAETTEQDDFKTIYANFGYNGDYNAQYFENPNAAQGELAGQMSYTVDLGKFRIVAIDSCCYSPDGGNGMGTNEHITAGRIDEDLMPWVVDQIKDAEEAGDTVIGLMHHGVVPHFQGEEDLLYEYVVDDWQNVATQFADAGMRYVFTGHMHANDITQYTSVSGNTITDLETGSLSSWMSPQRHVTITKGEALGDGTNRTKESFSVTSHSVKSIDFTDHNGQTQHIEDFRAYTQQKLYPETLFNNMANGMLRPILQEIGETGIRPWLAENLPDVDIDTMVLDVARDALAGGMEIELGTGVGRVSVSYRNNGIQLQPSGTAGWVLDDMTITDDQILRLVDGVLDIVETKYIENPDWLLGEIDKIVTKVSNMGITSLTDKEHSIYDLVLVVLTGHYAGCENPPAWVESALAYIESGEIVQNLINTLKTDLMPIINTLLADNSIDTGIAFSGLWKTAIDTATDDGNLKATLDLFGFDEAAISELIDGLINEYLTPSFLTGMGSLISDVARSMLYDVNFTDDVIDSDSAVVIEFDGSKNAPDASVENGLLPTQVTMTLGADSENSRNFRWYTGLNVDSGTVQVATDSGFSSIVAEADASREEVVKPKTRMNLGLITTYGTQEAAKYSASVTGLDDGATYYYRVGDKDANLWSAAYQFATGDAADGDDAFTFINVNDSQGMVESDYDVYLNTLAQADVTFPTAAFTIHAGDFVDDGANEDYWTWALDDEDGVAQGMAMTPAAGNHEAKSEVEGITDANPIVSHFNLANVPQGQDLSTGVYYSYVYKNATFVVLNTNDLEGNSLSSAQYNWAYDTLANADTEWKIVLMHKSPYSNGPHQADDDVLAIRSQINSLAAATDVDVVLSGHDHVYNRTPYLAHGNEQNVTTETQNYEGVNYETALNPSGTVFVIAGTCGVKNYAQDTSGGVPSEVALDLSVPVFTGITIDGDHLYYRAYKVEGGGSALVDSFAISKAEEDAAPAWKQVEDMIAALPEQSEVTTDDKAAIEAARVAYDELSAEDQQKVSNYDRLVAAERMLSLLQNVAGKRTVTVRNSGGLKTALEDSTVGTINVEGEIDSGEGLFTNGDRELYVTHDKVIGGTGKLTIFKFHVQNGATLVLKDSVYIDNTRTQGSTYRAWNPIEVHANSTLITQNDVSLRTEYGSGGSEEGVAVKLMESGATAILGSSGSYWGAEAAVLSTASGTTLVINDGTYNAKNNNRVVVDTHGDATVNGGTISSMWISGTLRVNGGTFEHQDSASSNWTPLAVSGANAYITGGTFGAFNGRDGNASIKLENNAKLHVLADTNGAVNIGSATPYVGSPSTSDYKNVKLGYVKSNGWNASQDGIYRVEGSASASSVEDIAKLNATRLSTNDVSNNGSYMTSTLPDGTSTVFGKYWIYGGTGDKGAPSGSGIIGSGDVIVYGPTRIIQNNPVTGVTIDGEDLRVVDLREEGADTLRLNGYTTPADAFDNGITWSSDNKQTAKVEESAGQGVVTLDVPGGAVITATSDSKPDLSDSVEIIAVEPKFADTVEEIAWNQDEAIIEASAGFLNDTYKDRISFEYSTDNKSIATFEPEVDPETGEPVSELEPGTLRKISRGMVKVTAELLVDSEPTGITVSKDVFCDAAPEAPTYDELAELLDVTVADGNEAMAAEHAAQTFDLIENTSEQTDSYSVGKVSAVEEAPGSLGEALANLTGLAKAGANWNVDVTVYADAYVKAFDDNHNMAEGTHAYDGDLNKRKTVKLVWSEGDDQADPAVEAGWKLEKENDSPVQFNVKCTSYQVDFKYVGEDWANVDAPEPVNVLAGAEIGNKLPAPKREGFTFVGWYKDWDETDGFKDENLVTRASTIGADTTLYGRWAVGAQAMNAYVVFDPSGGAFAEDDETPKVVQVELTSGADHVDTEDVPADPSLANHVFAGWYYKAVSEDVPDGAELPFNASATEIVGNLHVYAKWTAKTFTVNFDADGGAFEGNEGDPITVTYDQNWPELPTPTKAGMNFNGWLLGEGEDAVRIISGTPVKITGNATLKAQWTDKVAIVVTVGQENEFVYDGVEHSFSYTTDPEGVEMTVEYRPAAGESDEDWSPALPVDAGAYDVRLTHVEDETYAEFSAAIGHVLVIDKADQTLPEQFFSASTFGDYVLVTFSSADMVGNLEWANNEGFVDAAEVTQGDTFEVRSEGAYYLRFKGDANHNPSPSASFTVVKATFDVGEGVLSQGDKAAWLIQSGTTLGGNLPEASREGYRFDGWFAGETQIGAETQINDSIAAAAKWTANTYTVTFDADGGTLPDGAQSAITVTYDQQWPELPEPTMTGKFFQGWFLDDAEVSAGATVKIIGDTTLTAHWGDKQAITVTPTQDANSFTYDGEPHAFAYAVDPEGVTGLTVEYAAAGVDDWSETAPTNADTYDVRVTRDEDDTYAAYEQTFEGGLVIAKADGAAAPELGVTADAEGAMIAFEPAEGVDYEYADNTDFAEAKDVEDGGFQATEPGTWYVRAKGDANHEPGEAAGVQIAKVTFDAASGIVEGGSAWFLKSGESVGEGNLPTATREGFEFAGWTVDGEPFDGTTPVIGDIIAIAGWTEVGDEPGPDEPQAPAAPVADEVATLEGVTVTLNGVNEINSDEGNKTHPDVTFASVGEDVQPLIAKSFTIGQPAETDGVWTVEVTMDAQKYLDAYAAMGDPAYGAHYFANADEDGVETFALTYDADARAWVLADAQQAAFAYDITCLTLRPAEAEIYTGGTSENGGHFIDQYVVDGRGNVVSIDELNERLDEGVTASIKYYDADGNEVTDDTVAGHYIARIDVSAAEEQARAAAIDDTVEVNVGGREYTFNLEPSELVIRSVSDVAEAERGDLNVALVDGSDAQAVATALGRVQGGVVAALPGETTILFNGNPEVEIADRSDITLLSDDLLPGGREDALRARVQEVLGADALADNTDFQYLDLVDRSQSNAWVSSTAGTQVFWRIPEGADTGSIKILHFVDLHRDYTMADEDVADLIAGCDVEAMSLTFDEENGFVSFAVPGGGFSPFLMTWNDAVDDPDDPDQPGTDPDQPGTDPDQPGADPEDPDQPAQKVTVTFDANGGQLSTGTPGSVEIAAGGTIAMLPQPVRTGYAFVGWTTADGTAFDITTPVNESMTVIAQWRPIVYQISLDAQGGALAADEASIEVTFDAPIGKLPVPTREGYEFLGWFTQPQGGDEVTAETMYRTAGPSTYYAQWDVLPATQVVLTLDANGGMFQGGQETIAEVVAINAPLHSSDLTVPQREGFELAGWYLDESLTQPVVLVEDADPDAGIVATTFAQDATLYAKWLEDLSSDADISFGGILQAYTGSAMPGVPTFGESFPNDERTKVQVLYRASLMRANEWTDQAPINVGTYDVRFVYEGSGEYAAFAKDYPAGITITKATLAQVGLTVDTPEVEAGTKLADVSLEGATVTSQVTGAVIEGIWAWLDADGVIDETGAYQAVFVPADAENFEPLHVEIQLTVKEAGADKPGGSDEPTDPTDPGLPGTDPADPDNQPGAGTGTDTGSGSGTGAGTGAGTGSSSDGADGRNQMKLVATGDPVAGIIVGFGAVLLAALITGLVALRNTRRKN